MQTLPIDLQIYICDFLRVRGALALGRSSTHFGHILKHAHKRIAKMAMAVKCGCDKNETIFEFLLGQNGHIAAFTSTHADIAGYVQIVPSMWCSKSFTLRIPVHVWFLNRRHGTAQVFPAMCTYSRNVYAWETRECFHVSVRINKALQCEYWVIDSALKDHRFSPDVLGMICGTPINIQLFCGEKRVGAYLTFRK